MVTIATSKSQLLCKMQKYNLQYFGLWRCFYCLSWCFGSHSLSRDLWHLRHCHSSWSFFLLHRSQKSICAGTSATVLQSPRYLCKLPCWITNWSVLLHWDEASNPKDEGISKFAKLFWVPTTPISYIHSLWSFDELLQFFVSLSAWPFNCVSIC